MRISIHGHRGARGQRPENTLPAIQYALEHQVDGVEVDLCVSKDDEIILHHDLCLNPATTRDANGNWLESSKTSNTQDTYHPIRTLTLSEIRQYDVGRLNPTHPYAKQFPEQAALDGVPIPTLEECIELIRPHRNTTVLNLEMKSDPEHPTWTPAPQKYVSLLVEKLEQLDFSEHVFLQSFDAELIYLAKQLRPNWKWKVGVIHSRDTFKTNETDCLAEIQRNGGDVFSCEHSLLTKPMIKTAHDLGLEVYVWTVNNKLDAKKMAHFGVNAITTDYPEQCHSWI